jgi:hypothetical protein
VHTSYDGQLIQNQEINGHLTIRNRNVKVDNVCVLVNGGGQAGSGDMAIDDSGGSGTLIENSTIGGANATDESVEIAVSSQDSGLTLNHDYVLNCGECLHDAYFTLRDSYVIVNGLLPSGQVPEHYEDVYLNMNNGGATFVANHDTLFNQFDQTSVLFGDTQNGGRYHSGSCGNHWSVKGSLLAGGGDMITACAGSSGVGSSTMDFENNHFARCLTTPLRETAGGNLHCSGGGFNGSDAYGYYPRGGSYGDDYETYCPPTSGQIWSGNVWDDSGADDGC